MMVIISIRSDASSEQTIYRIVGGLHGHDPLVETWPNTELLSEHVIRRSSKVTQSTQTEDANEEIEKEQRFLEETPSPCSASCGYKRYHEELWPLNTRLYVNSNHKQAKI